MTISAVLSIDDGSTLRDETNFEMLPQVGHIIRFWRNGREWTKARVTELSHSQTEGGYALIVEAETVAER